jgi:hypothetical protein
MIGMPGNELQEYLGLMMSALGRPGTIDKTRFVKDINVWMTWEIDKYNCLKMSRLDFVKSPGACK